MMNQDKVYIVRAYGELVEDSDLFPHHTLEGAKRSGEGLAGDGCLEQWEYVEGTQAWTLGRTGIWISCHNVED